MPYHAFPNSSEYILEPGVYGVCRSIFLSRRVGLTLSNLYNWLVEWSDMRCPVCKVGRLHSVRSDRGRLTPFLSKKANREDVVRRKRCEWCALDVVTVERVEAMLTAPDGNKIAELERAQKHGPDNKVR